MLQIEPNPKLDFGDVLIKPKWSPNTSRKDVKLEREFKFFYSNRTWNGIPIISANMDTTGSYNMYEALRKLDCITCLHKHYSPESLLEFTTNELHDTHRYFISCGITDDDLSRLYEHLETHAAKRIRFPNICLDVANGYSNKFTDAIKYVRELTHSLIAVNGNIVQL